MYFLKYSLFLLHINNYVLKILTRSEVVHELYPSGDHSWQQERFSKHPLRDRLKKNWGAL